MALTAFGSTKPGCCAIGGGADGADTGGFGAGARTAATAGATDAAGVARSGGVSIFGGASVFTGATAGEGAGAAGSGAEDAGSTAPAFEARRL